MRIAAVDLETRLAEKIAFSDEHWLWVGGSSKNDGYGRAWLNGSVKLAHRVVYEKLRGPIPDGLQLDHLCTFEPV